MEVMQVADWMGVLIGIAGLIIGVISLIFAYYQYAQRIRVEKVVRDMLRGVAGGVRVVFANANWADTHLRKIGYFFTEANPDLTAIRQKAFDAARDATACARQLALTHLQIRGVQQALFNDSEETVPLENLDMSEWTGIILLS
jgi:hypothetical protein